VDVGSAIVVVGEPLPDEVGAVGGVEAGPFVHDETSEATTTTPPINANVRVLIVITASSGIGASV
jgi:hypothetical protein